MQTAGAEAWRHPLIIFGSGGHGRVAADCARLMGRWSTVTFYDDSLGADQGLDALCSLPSAGREAFVAIGRNSVREQIQTRLEEAGFSLATLVHPSAVIAADSELGAGTLAAAGSILNPGARVGRGCIINTAASVDHDCSLGDFVHVSPGAHLAGTVSVGNRTWIGIGAAVIEGRSIGQDATIAAGAVVTRDISDNRKVMGVPAK